MNRREMVGAFLAIVLLVPCLLAGCARSDDPGPRPVRETQTATQKPARSVSRDRAPRRQAARPRYNRWAGNPAIRPAIEAAVDDVASIYPSQDHRLAEAAEPSTRSFGEGPVKVYLVGDSMMAQWWTPLSTIGSRHGWRLYPRTRSGTAFAFLREGTTRSSRAYSAKVLAHVRRDRPDLVLMSTTSRVSAEGIRDANRRLRKAGAGKVILVADTPKPDPSEARLADGVPACLATARREKLNARTYCGFGRRGTKDWDGSTTPAMREAVKGTDMELVSMNDLINRATVHGGTSAPIIDNTIVLRDKTHLTNTFAVRTEKSLEARLRRAGAFGIDGDRAG